MGKTCENLSADETSYMSINDKWRTAALREICSAPHKSCVQLQEVYPGTDNFSCNEAYRKAFCKLPKCDPREVDKGSVLILIIFDAAISGCIQSIKNAL